MKQFWMVWNLNGNQPRYTHTSESLAENEAKRLARANPGERFVVLEAVSAHQVTDMHSISLRDCGDSDIPF